MVAANPYDDKLTELRNQLAGAEVQLAKDLESLSAYRAQLAKWESMGEYENAQATAAEVRVRVDMVKTSTALVERLKRELSDVEKAWNSMNAAAAAAIAGGMNPAVAYQKAYTEQLGKDQLNKTLKTVAIIIGTLLLMWGLWYFLIRKR